MQQKELSSYEEGYLRGRLAQIELIIGSIVRQGNHLVDKRKKEELNKNKEIDPLKFLAGFPLE